MKQTHYTPTIDEFHVGFEFQEYYSAIPNGCEEGCPISELLPPEWINISCGIHRDINYINDILIENLIRVKYLDKDDILSLGFVEAIGPNSVYFKWPEEANLYGFYCGLTLHHWKDKDDNVTLITSYPGVESDTIFRGKVKNKSELKKVLQMIGVI